MNANRRLDVWIALNVTKTLRRLSDDEYADLVAICEDVNKEPHPNLELTTPSRFEGVVPEYTADSGAAMQVLKCCMKHLDRLTGRTDFQIVVLYDEGSTEPYCVTTDSQPDADDPVHVQNCASAETLELAICRFARHLHTKNDTAESSNSP